MKHAESPCKPLQLANYFILQEPNISHLKLQKLVYCTHGWWLAFRKEGKVPFIQGDLLDELPQAQQYGPIYASLYAALRHRKLFANPVPPMPGEENNCIASDDSRIPLLDWVSDRYIQLSGFDMSDLTHKEGSPWHQVTNGGKHVNEQPIAEDAMEKEFTRLLVNLRNA